jgi:serine/threonine-protein kinase
MSLDLGTQLGPFVVVSAIGSGGMGEVYRARDTRLKRDVALKILPESFASDTDRLARFQREAEVLASLNHPNIAAIYGLEQADGRRAIVMELVDGETLADRISRGPVPIDEALPIANQITEALEAAHEQGIIHRDLKPANIKITSDGRVKVLDFGLAKLQDPMVSTVSKNPNALSMSPTITSPAMTGVGVLLGTAAYMSPEQAKGRPADKRSDIWAFGCVLYEMLAGKRAFEGDDVADTLANVLKMQPDWEALPRDTPPAIVALIRRSLDKDRRRRIADVAAAMFVLSENLISFGEAPMRQMQSNSRRRRMAMAGAFVAAAGVAAGGWWLGVRSRPVDSKPVTRFTIALRGDEQFSTNGRRFIALSPDGTHLAYIANGRVNVRALDRLESVPIPSTARGVVGTGNPFFSPDGQWIGFWQDGQIRKVRVDGGATLTVVPAADASAGLAWEDDGTILFASQGNILRVPEAGGTPEIVVGNLKGSVQSVQLLPGKRTILFTLFPEGMPGSEIIVRSLDTGQQQTLIRDGIDARYLPTGHIVYFAGGNLLAVPFDLGTLKVRGSPAPVADDIPTSGVPGRTNNVAHFAISQTGTLAFVAGIFVEQSPRTLVWVDRRGIEEPLGVPDRPYVYPRLSPDGGRVALTIRDQERDIWIWEISRKTLRRFTLDPGEDRYEAWTPDGKRLAFGSQRGDGTGAWWQAADGSGVPERLAGFPFNRFANFFPTTISPDGSRMIVTASGGSAGQGDLWLVPLTGNPQPVPLLDTPTAERNAEVSPDGRWMAYESIEAGRTDVYVRPFPDVANGRWPVTTGGGSQPLWARSGKELFYLDPAGALMSVSVEGERFPAIGTPTRILDGAYVTSVPTYAGRLYDISPDGQRFLMLKQSASGAQTNGSPTITVVQNWQEEVKRLVPTD